MDLEKFGEKNLAVAPRHAHGRAGPEAARDRGMSDGPSHSHHLPRARKEGRKKRERKEEKSFFFPFPPVGVPPEGDEPTGHEDESQ